MKKTIIALIALAGVAYAGTEFTDLSTGKTLSGITYNLPAAESTKASFTGSISKPGGGDVAEVGVALTLNLTDIQAFFSTAENSTKSITLMTFDVDTNVGLALTNSGITGMWDDKIWNNASNFTISYASLNDTWVGKDGDTYVTIAVSHANVGGNDGGLMVYSPDEKLGGYNGLGSSSNDNMTKIEFDTAYVISAAINPGWSDSSTCQSLAASLATSTKAITGVIPEPTTATLSLLALCGLAARRRRK